MNLVEEIWFGLVERQAVRRGVFKSVPETGLHWFAEFLRLGFVRPSIRFDLAQCQIDDLGLVLDFATPDDGIMHSAGGRVPKPRHLLICRWPDEQFRSARATRGRPCACGRRDAALRRLRSSRSSERAPDT